MGRVKGRRAIYAFAKKGRVRYLVIFNIYGSSAVLQALRVIAEGGVRRVFFLGSMGAKNLDIGKVVLPTAVIDKTGLVHIDTPGKSIVVPSASTINKERGSLKRLCINYAEGKIISVPAPLHNMDHIHSLKLSDPEIQGEEMELSTFYHFSQKDRLSHFALLYVSDNKKVHLTSDKKSVMKSRREGLRNATRVALDIL